MTRTIDAGTRLVALLGDPVLHSLSPIIQNAAFAHANVPGVYLALRTGGPALPQLLRAIAEAGGAGNVTVPHKAAAAAAVDRRTPAVDRTGACNTFWAEDGEVWGDNTDVEGFRAALATLRPEGFAGADVLLVGAGGAARAVLAGLEDEGAARVTILNRTPDRSLALVARFQHGPLDLATAEGASTLRSPRFDLVVNATSLGLHPGDALPLEPRAVDAGTALDLVYAPDGRTPWVRALHDRNVPAIDGTEMLVHQAAAAFRRWWGRSAAVDVMRAALRERR